VSRTDAAGGPLRRRTQRHYRQAAVLVGVVPLLARLRAPGLAVLLAVLLALGAAMAHLFFVNVLV
jgi:hypothetical protein